MERSWQRARRPEEKEARRQSLVDAARRLALDKGLLALSLSDIARLSGVSKANIYRYYESREDVLLGLWLDEIEVLEEALAAAFAHTPDGDLRTTARAIVAAFEAQPLLCELMAIVAPILERKLQPEALARAKRASAALTLRVATVLHERLPTLAIESCAWAAGVAATYVAGLWPASRVPAQPTDDPEVAALRPVFARDLQRFLEVLFVGLGASVANDGAPRHKKS